MELFDLLALIPQDEHGIEKTVGRDTLASTGVLWGECDKMVALGAEGLTKLAAGRVEEYHGLLKDAIAELEEWDPDEDAESDADSVISDGAKGLSTRRVDTSLSVRESSPSPMAALRIRTLATLRIIRMLYPAIVKRRILTFPRIDRTTTTVNLPSASHVRNLDALVDHTKNFTEETDEVAGGLYAGAEDEINERLTKLAEMSKTCVQGIRFSWDGNEDEFTTWAAKWMARLEEVRRG